MNKDHFGSYVSQCLTPCYITTATSQKNVTPRGITTNKPSHCLIFWAFETWVLATEFQPEHNQMLTQFPVNGLFGCCLRHPWAHYGRTRGTDQERSLPVSWSEALAGAGPCKCISGQTLCADQQLERQTGQVGADPHHCNCLCSTNFIGVMLVYQSIENVTQSIKAEILCKCWFISALSLEFIQRAFTSMFWIA